MTGLRRTGKSSFILVGLRELGKPHIYIDARVFEDKPYISYGDFLKSFEKAINRAGGKKLREILKGVEGVEIYGVSIRFKWGGGEKARLPEVLEAINSLGEERGRR